MSEIAVVGVKALNRMELHPECSLCGKRLREDWTRGRSLTESREKIVWTLHLDPCSCRIGSREPAVSPPLYSTAGWDTERIAKIGAFIGVLESWGWCIGESSKTTIDGALQAALGENWWKR